MFIFCNIFQNKLTGILDYFQDSRVILKVSWCVLDCQRHICTLVDEIKDIKTFA